MADDTNRRQGVELWNRTVDLERVWDSLDLKSGAKVEVWKEDAMPCPRYHTTIDVEGSHNDEKNWKSVYLDDFTVESLITALTSARQWVGNSREHDMDEMVKRSNHLNNERTR